MKIFFFLFSFLLAGTPCLAIDDDDVEMLGLAPSETSRVSGFPGGVLTAMKFEVTRAGKLDKFAINLNNAIRVRMFLYAATTPIRLVAETGIFTSVRGLNVLQPLSQPYLTPGAYYLTFLYENDAESFVRTPARNITINYMISKFDAEIPETFDAWPASFTGQQFEMYFTVNSPVKNYSCLNLVNGKIYCFGSNKSGQLGLGHGRDIGDELDETSESFAAVQLGSDFFATKTVGAPKHVCSLNQDGQLKCWGENTFGQLGLGDLNSRGLDAGDMGDALPAVGFAVGEKVKDVALGTAHSCALLDNGKIKCWGNNENGELGLGDAIARNKPTVAVDLGTNALALKIAAGNNHTCALLSNNDVKCWGFNQAGQLGQEMKISLGSKGSDMGNKLLPIKLGTTATVNSIAAGANFTCINFANGTLKCFGENHFGQLGAGNTLNRGDEPNQMGDALPTVALGTGQQVRQLACGSAHCCVLLLQNTMKCWGMNTYGGLGLGDTLPRGQKENEMGENLPFVSLSNTVVKRMHLGYGHTCIMDDLNQWKCWGNNSRGQLGQSDVSARGNNFDTLPESVPYLNLN